jgi:hypothetical protein
MDPFGQFTHGGVLNVAEIQYHTSFDYMFPLLAANPQCLLPPGAATQGALLALGTAMATDDTAMSNDSTIPAIFTYFGQFIDHDITAQTDREIGVSRIATPDGNVMDVTPLPSSVVVTQIVNGRRPQLDLDHVYGDGPSVGTGAEIGATEGDVLFDGTGRLKVVPIAGTPFPGGGFDVPRQPDGTAIIADMRNNENLNVNQLHCAFLLFHNKIVDALPAGLTPSARYIRARKLVRWAYQYIVLHDYLPAVCDPLVVEDVFANGLRYYAPDVDYTFMPIEFSVAAFRFAHSMIRPAYKINVGPDLSLADVLRATGPLLVGGKLDPANVIQWRNFVQIGVDPAPQMARKIDPLISAGLGALPVNLPGSTIPLGALLQHLARRNLLRGYLLSAPTGQAVADAMDIKALQPADLVQNVAPAIANAVIAGGFDTATPLWYYILQEANFQHQGKFLGSVGSRIVAETLTGLIQRYPSSYVNFPLDPAIKANGIQVAPGQVIGTLADLLAFAGVPL